MTRARRNLSIFYGLVAAVALFTTWNENLFYLLGGAGPFGVIGFLDDLRASPAGRSAGIDLAVLCVAAMTFMILEARRLGMRFVWAYVALGFIVAIAVTFPLFLIARERHIAWQEGGEIGSLAVADGLGIAAVTAVVTTMGAFILG